MNQQDELAKLIRKIDETTDGLGEWHDATEYLEWARKEVQRILNASRPRVVETIEQLDALPFLSVIRDAEGDIYECVEWNNGPRLMWTHPADIYPRDPKLPATVLHMPEEAW